MFSAARTRRCRPANSARTLQFESLDQRLLMTVDSGLTVETDPGQPAQMGVESGQADKQQNAAPGKGGGDIVDDVNDDLDAMIDAILEFKQENRGHDTPCDPTRGGHDDGPDGSVLPDGMRQRLAIARALGTAPSLLLLDEPLGDIDSLDGSWQEPELDGGGLGGGLGGGFGSFDPPVKPDVTGTENSDDDGTDDGGSTGDDDGPVVLPPIGTATIHTAVTVPDGGTVLIGGIRRTGDSTPDLSNLPYIGRLFRNIPAPARDDSLMIMITPRIIIQIEE